GIVIAPFLLGRANHPLARGSTETMGAQDSGHVAAWTRRGLPGADGLAQLVHAAMVADFGHHLIATTQEPIEDLGRAKAPIQAEHNLGPTFAAPAQMGFDLQDRSFQGWHRRLFSPEQRLVEDLPIRARGDAEGFATGFTAVPPHPGPLAPFGLGPNRH